MLILETVDNGINDGRELFAMGKDDGDDDTLLAVEADNAGLEQKLAVLEFRRMFDNPLDPNPCFLEIQAGAGGTEAQDWAAMLLRMYLKFGEKKGFTVEVMEESEGEVAGLKGATIKFTGDYAYGTLRTETGIHRLVRISPFDSAGKRHTSFASLDATPEVSDSINIEILDKDLKVDTYRSGGKGGQNVNKVETAVRITHIPSGVIVACQNERSQLRNKEEAMNMLRAKLYQIEEDKKQAEADRQYSEKGDIGWGNQIRSYVFQPYQMVKDLRTGVESGNIQDVMDGNLDPFIEAMLRGHKRER